MSSFQAVTRTIIMLGTLAVGAMAWKVYGPPPEQLAPIINRLIELAGPSRGDDADQPLIPEIIPPPLSIDDEISAIPLPEGATLRVDPEVSPAAHVAPAPTEASLQELLAQLHAMGAIGTELKPWGASGQVFRCQCRATLTKNPLLERHFDAIHGDPRAAVEQVLGELQTWRQEQGN